MRAWVLTAIAGLAVLTAVGAARAAPLPPAEAFGSVPALQDAAISPDGKRVAWIGGPPDVRVLSIAPIDGRESATVMLGDVRALDVQWAGPDYVLVRIMVHTRLGTRYDYEFIRTAVFDTHARLVTHLLKNSVESNASPDLPLLEVTPGPPATAYIQGVDLSTHMAGDNFTRLKVKEGDLAWAIWKVDVATGEGVVIARGGPEVETWALDLKGEPQARVDSTGKLREETIMVRKGPQAWRELVTGEVDLQGYSDRDNAVYWSEKNAAGDTVIKKVDLASGQISIVGPPDPAGDAWLAWDDLTNTPIAIERTGGREATWLDPQLGQVHAILEHAFSGRRVYLTNWSADRTRYVVKVVSDDAPTDWYLFDTAHKDVSILGPEYPAIDGRALSTTQFFTYKARDGLTIPAFLRLPAGRPAAKLPLVVMPHGGPEWHDSGEFDWWAAFLVSRGYAVFQPQFRGSDGFGAALLKAGAGEWGGKMQTDIMDGIDYLAKQGTIDPARICIVGASYGGFAALQNLVQFPGVYRCAVSVNGVTDPGELVSEVKAREGGDSSALRYLRDQLGLNDNIPVAAPARHVDQITAPVMIVYSEQDTRVPPVESQRMVKLLQAAHKPVEVVALPGDDHFLQASASRITMLNALADFLAKNLPATP